MPGALNMKSGTQRRFKGVMPYLVTPLLRSGEVNGEVLARLCDDLIAQGVHGVTPLGSTGEFAYLNKEQRERTVEVTIEAAAGRVPVIAGVASTSIAESVSQIAAYEKLNVDGILAILESYFPLSDADVEHYFRSLAAATDLPIIIYTNPNFQRSDLTIPVIERLSKIANIVGLKDASTNTGRLLSILNRCGDDLDIFAASSHIPASVMMMGGKGWLAGPACVIPKESVALYNLCKSGAWDEAIHLQKKLWSVNEVFARYSLAACIKAILELQGYAVGDPVAPQRPLTQEERKQIMEALDGVLGLSASIA